MIIPWIHGGQTKRKEKKEVLINGPVASSLGNLYNDLIDLMLGRYRVPHSEVNVT